MALQSRLVVVNFVGTALIYGLGCRLKRGLHELSRLRRQAVQSVVTALAPISA